MYIYIMHIHHVCSCIYIAISSDATSQPTRTLRCEQEPYQCRVNKALK